MKPQNPKHNYKSAEARILYLVAKKSYGSLTKMAASIGITRQYLNQFFTLGIPIKYAGIIAEKTCFDPGLLNYESYLLFYRGAAYSFQELMKEAQCYFSKEECAYIIKGEYIKYPSKFLAQDKT